MDFLFFQKYIIPFFLFVSKKIKLFLACSVEDELVVFVLVVPEVLFEIPGEVLGGPGPDQRPGLLLGHLRHPPAQARLQQRLRGVNAVHGERGQRLQPGKVEKG